MTIQQFWWRQHISKRIIINYVDDIVQIYYSQQDLQNPNIEPYRTLTTKAFFKEYGKLL